MDGSTVEHSDSDSVESWTMLETALTYGDDAPDLPESATIPRERSLNEKDDDTDGISIISDSENESSSASCDYSYIKSQDKNPIPAEQQKLLFTPLNNGNHNNDPVKEQPDYLDNVQFRTYFHRRNPKVGTLLDMIMLGTFVITAGLALGHLWSSKNECTPQTSVNEILSNLYKLQEENEYLKNKINEISLATGYPLVQRKSDKPVTKLQRCKKIFEEPIMKNNREPGVKCVADKPVPEPQRPYVTVEPEQDLLNHIAGIKEAYEEIKNTLDEDFKKQLEGLFKVKNKKQFDEFNEANRYALFSLVYRAHNEPYGPIDIENLIKDCEAKSGKMEMAYRQINLEEQLGPTYYNMIPKKQPNTKDDAKINVGQKEPKQNLTPPHTEDVKIDTVPKKKITYADSLKIDQPLQRTERALNNDKPNTGIKDHAGKRKHKYDNDLLLNTVSEEDIKKDDRYTGPKTKHEKKKHDRQKSNKKQKRINKYEQWEMKGGYLKDFDELSLASSQDNDKNLLSNPDRKFKDPDFENYVIKFIDAEINENNASNKDHPKIDNKNNEKDKKVEKRALKGDPRKKVKSKDFEWYDQRTALRAEARMKLEHELFGENTSNNGAAWYFRRMQKREQCRAQKDNSTFKKFSKRKMNFKMKR